MKSPEQNGFLCRISDSKFKNPDFLNYVRIRKHGNPVENQARYYKKLILDPTVEQCDSAPMMNQGRFEIEIATWF